MADHKLIQIDLRQVLTSKMGASARWIPSPLVSWLQRTIRQDDLNALLRECYPARDAEFCRKVMESLDVRATITNPQALPAPGPDARVIFVCNHPLGGLDGIVLIAELCERYGSSVKFVVNDLLMAVEPLQGVFLPINKHGRQSRKSISDINAAMAGDGPILIFPAGLVSRLGKDGEIRDLEWQKMFATKAVQHHRDVVPLHFFGHNSPKFYKVARWRKRLRIPFNIEMLYLPGEVIDSRGSHYRISVGERISWQTLASQPAAKSASLARQASYSLSKL